jgi:hypothetical protein
MSGTYNSGESFTVELLATRAVEAKDGWLCQVLMAGEIVHETKHHETAEDALEEAFGVLTMFAIWTAQPFPSALLA